MTSANHAPHTDDTLTEIANFDLPLESVLSADQFKLAFRDLPAGVSVITAEAGGEKAAMTATSVTSLSATPPLLMFSASQLSSSTAVIAQADTVVVHILGSGQLALAQLCATSGVDRFESGSATLPTGEPYFPAAQVWIRGRIVNRLAAGASVVHIVEALDSNVELEALHTASDPLVYHNRTWHHLSAVSVID